MIIGFTGTRNGMTSQQKEQVTKWLESRPDYTIAYVIHGACVGADEDFVRICHALKNQKFVIFARPGRSVHGGNNEYLSRTACELSGMVYDAETHFARNRKIVADCTVLLACPYQQSHQAHGGTWYTVDQARKKGKQVVIFWPNGDVGE